MLLRKRSFYHCQLTLFVLIFLCSCGSGDNSSHSSSSGDSATLSFQLQFQRFTDLDLKIYSPKAADPDVCEDYLIETIQVDVHRSSDDSVVASAERPCSDHVLTVNDLPAGVSLYVVCKGYVGQQLTWQGQVTDIVLSEGESRDVGPILMDYLGDDQTPPQVVTVYPDDGAVDVNLNTSITILFNEPLAPSSISDEAIVVMNGGTAIPGRISYDPATYIISYIPDGLSPATIYTFTLMATADDHVTDTAGLALIGNFSWQFTTSSNSEDTTPPLIISSAPSSDNVPLDTTIQATFNESMDPNSLNDTVFLLSSDQGSVDGEVAYNADTRTVTLTPSVSLEAATQYAATITTDARDLSGNALTAPYSWTFNTLTPQYTLTVNRNGTGTVTSSPSGINCGTTCSHDFYEGAVVTLGAAAGGDSIFTGWSGAGCSGTGECQVTMAADTAVTASFEQAYTITATAGAGGQIEPAGTIRVIHGENQAFTITAESGHYLADLIIDGTSVTEADSYEFTSVSGNHSIEAVFKTVWYVDASVAGGDGLSWTTAFATVQDAVNAAADGHDIWIRAGTYNFSDQIVVNRRISLYGGFTNTARFFHERNWGDNPVIFDGQDASRSFFISTDARLDGFIIQNCSLSSDSYTQKTGAALYISDCSPTLANCTFRDNKIDGGSDCLGGAISADNSSPTFENCHFEDNYVECEYPEAGALYLNNCTTTFDNSRFINNSAGQGYGSVHGGAIYIIGGTATVQNCDFLQNRLSSEGSYGGAICASDVDLTVSNCNFIGNQTSGSGSGRGGAIHLTRSATNKGSVIQNTIFLNNSGSAHNSFEGGALFNNEANPLIVNSTFSGNDVNSEANANGGAIGGAARVTNSILWGNRTLIDKEIEDNGTMQVSDATVTYSVIDQDGFNGNGNLREDPQIDAFGHLRPGSVCLDKADDSAAPDTDIDGESRPQNNQSDIGADEFVDGDADQMPDYWEARYGLEIGVDDSGADLDDDGLSNLYEYQFDLNPAEANPVHAAQNRGWYDDTGFHDQSDNSTRCGFGNSTEHRPYFIFELPGGSGTVTGAILRLELADYQGFKPSMIFRTYEVVTEPATLEASGSGQVSIFNDLGDGVRYAEDVSISPADSGTIVSIPLSAEAIEAINTSLGGNFSVGLRPWISEPDENDIFLFSEASEARVHQLVMVVE